MSQQKGPRYNYYYQNGWLLKLKNDAIINAYIIMQIYEASSLKFAVLVSIYENYTSIFLKS